MGTRKSFRILLFLLIGLANLGRGVMAFRLWPHLRDWPMRVDLRWIGAAYLLWGLLFVGTAWLLRRSRLALLMWPVALAYEGFVWALALLTEQNDYQQQIRPRNLWLSLLFLMMVAYLARPSTGAEANARTQGGPNGTGTATLDVG